MQEVLLLLVRVDITCFAHKSLEKYQSIDTSIAENLQLCEMCGNRFAERDQRTSDFCATLNS